VQQHAPQLLQIRFKTQPTDEDAPRFKCDSCEAEFEDDGEAVTLYECNDCGTRFTTLLVPGTNGDGAYPNADLILSGNTLYGTAAQGGISGNGVIFRVNTDGSGFSILHNFPAEDPVSLTNSDGWSPDGLILSGSTLYGTAGGGGSAAGGTVFKVNTNGTGFTVLHNFVYYDQPEYRLVLSGNILYGTTSDNGENGYYGTVFAVNTDGSNFKVISVLGGGLDEGKYGPYGLTLSGNTLYGATGGLGNFGTVFKVETNGMGFGFGFRNLPLYENPSGGLILSGNILYGTAEDSFGSDKGIVFAVNTNFSGFEILHSFTNSDGAQPIGDLCLSGNILYGTTWQGGSSSNGIVFAVKSDGTGFTNLYNFTASQGFLGYRGTNSDGVGPEGGLILSGNTLYGTTYYGGRGAYGTIFALTLVPAAPVITTQPQSQTAQVGNNVTFSVVANGWPAPNFQWQFNGQNIAGQTAPSLSLTNVQFTNAGGYSVIVTNAYGSVTSAVAQLTVFTNLVVAQTNKAPPLPGSPTIPTDATHFKVFTNGGFVTGLGLNPSKSTVVITHGWNDSSTIWPLEIANDIKLVLGASAPNIVAWDWTAEATNPLPTATLDTQGQGYALGEDLAAALGPNYSQRIHFIGHSLGTLVNARAANYIHANGFSWTNTQMTLFDDAEVAWGLVGNSWATLTSLLQNDSSPQQDWIQPLPTNCAWADNYITAVGMPHPQAVNVILTNMAPDLSNIQNLFDFGIGAWTGQFKTEITDYHDYPYIWYFNTINQINNPNDPPYLMGFSRSWEGGGSAARPSVNSYYIQSTVCPPSFPSYSGYDPAYNLVQITPDQANQYLNARPQNLISQVGVNLVSSSANILANNNNQQVQLLNGPAVNVSSQITGPAYAAATLIKLFTTSLISGNGLVRPMGGPVPMGGSAENSPAYVWIPVTVPTNALTMAFNFMLQGNGNQDSFQVAMNSNNLMTVETVLIQTNVTMSSGMIDVSQYAGQQAELFFGIVGGTSTNASLTVSDIAFYVTLPPSLQIQMAGTNVVLTWPLSAAGYVLQSANQLSPPVSWTAVTNVPVIVNFQYTVTNQISSGSRFYRLAIVSAPALQAQVSGKNFVLSWPINATGYVLQTTTNLTAANSWTAVANVPAVINGQDVVTNGISDRMRFYRLKAQ
jgi:uncharacterized repeat protein (TIGR03803 family)